MLCKNLGCGSNVPLLEWMHIGPVCLPRLAPLTGRLTNCNHLCLAFRELTGTWHWEQGCHVSRLLAQAFPTHRRGLGSLTRGHAFDPDLYVRLLAHLDHAPTGVCTLACALRAHLGEAPESKGSSERSTALLRAGPACALARVPAPHT